MKAGLPMLVRHVVIALALLGATSVVSAQETQAPAEGAAPAEMRATAAYPARQDARQWLGLNLIGAKVVSQSGETIGRVSNLILDENGTVASVVIAVGGLFGIGAKNVASTTSRLRRARRISCSRPASRACTSSSPRRRASVER